jgi:hypothetical protein
VDEDWHDQSAASGRCQVMQIAPLTGSIRGQIDDCPAERMVG